MASGIDAIDGDKRVSAAYFDSFVKNLPAEVRAGAGLRFNDAMGTIDAAQAIGDLKPGTLVIGENACEPGYVDYVRNPENGFRSLAMPFETGRGNEFTVVTR